MWFSSLKKGNILCRRYGPTSFEPETIIIHEYNSESLNQELQLPDIWSVTPIRSDMVCICGRVIIIVIAEYKTTHYLGIAIIFFYDSYNDK